MTEEFVNEKTGESVEGITIMIDGVIKDLFDIIKHEKNPAIYCFDLNSGCLF